MGNRGPDWWRALSTSDRRSWNRSVKAIDKHIYGKWSWMRLSDRDFNNHQKNLDKLEAKGRKRLS